MPRRILTSCDSKFLKEAADQVAALAARLETVQQDLASSKLGAVQCPHFSNFTEAMRRVHVFVAGAEEAAAAAKLKKFLG